MGGYPDALVLTLGVEVPVYGALLPEAVGCTHRGAAIAGGTINLVSHPIAFLLFVPIVSHALGWVGAVALVEALVWAFEATALWAWLRRDLGLIALIALIANGLSLSLGVLVFR